LLNRHADKERKFAADTARHLVEEAQLFIEAAYGYYQRMSEQQAKAKGKASIDVPEPETAEAT
jgi:hypothetical protein